METDTSGLRSGVKLPAGMTGSVVRLAIAQALAGANSTVIYATGAVIGSVLAPRQALATLPISVFVVGMAAFPLPMGVVAHRYGRRMAFLIGTINGVAVGVLAAIAMLASSFWLFCVAMFFGGAYAAVVLSFRFAAVDCVRPENRARAMSFVMAGGILAAVIGTQLVSLTMNLWPLHAFAATFVAQAAVAVVAGAVLSAVRISTPVPTDADASGGRSMLTISRQPAFVLAVLCAVVSYVLMNFLMTAAPLAMRLCGLSQSSANLGIQWHVIAMYAPSFFTGRLIARVGAPRVALSGLLLTGLAAAAGLAGDSTAHFWVALVLLGLGWNHGFVGASALVLECHTPQEKARVQAFNDFIVFGVMAIGSFLSGSLLAAHGWAVILRLSLFPVSVATIGLAFATLIRDQEHADPPSSVS